MRIFGGTTPRTQKEKDICDKIIKYTHSLEKDNAPGEVYERIKQRKSALLKELDQICKGDKNRYDEDIMYIKEHYHPIVHRRVRGVVNVNTPAGGVGVGLEVDDRDT